LAPSLNALQPESVPHGVDIVIVGRANGAVADNNHVLGEIYEMDYDEDEGMVKLPVLGSRRTGVRRGRYMVTGTVKAYFISTAIRSMLMGEDPVIDAGPTIPVSGLYHSLRPFNRYNIQVSAKISGVPVMTFINVTFSKEVSKWTENAFVEETITFEAEDILENPGT
jgi:hypothetical protein